MQAPTAFPAESRVFFSRARLGICLCVLLYLQLLMAFRSGPVFVTNGTLDFRMLYASGHIVRAGLPQQLYDYETQRRFQDEFVGPRQYPLGLMEPPFVALCFFPLSFLHFFPAFYTFLAINLGFLTLAILAIRPHLPNLSARLPLAPALLFVCFFPVLIALLQGQLSLALLAVCCIAFSQLKSGKALLAGAVFSLALIKFQIALPAVLLFLLWRQWRFLAGFSIGTAALAVISLVTIGIGNVGVFWHSLFAAPAVVSGMSMQDRFAVYPRRMPNLYGLFYALSGGHRWGLALTIAGSALILLWAARQRPSLPLATLAGLLVSYHLYLHDLSLLLLPLSLVLDKHLTSPAAQPFETYRDSALLHWRRWLARGSAIVLLFLSPLVLILVLRDAMFLVAVPVFLAMLAPSADLDAQTARGRTTLPGDILPHPISPQPAR